MNNYDIRRLAMIYAKVAELEAMKADNIEREQSGHASAYSGEAFKNVMNDLHNIANASDEQLFTL